MNILLLMIPITLLLSTLFIIAFIWVVNAGQYDDIKTPAYRILDDDQN